VVTKGERLGVLGKEGGSGGWSHLHFEIFSRQPSGRWGTQDGYAFLWQAYLAEYQPQILAVARPGHVIFAGQSIELDGSRSWSATGKITEFRWMLSSGAGATEAKVKRAYELPGSYCETLRVVNGKGEFDYDFVRVRVYDPKHPQEPPPRLHLAFYPTSGIYPDTEISFKGRAFDVSGGNETWNFGDGSPLVTTTSDGNLDQLAKDGYVIVKHRYEQPGDYLVHVRREDNEGHVAEDRLHIRVSPQP
jgi:hypothetical protein